MAARNPFASSIPDIYDPYAMIQSRPRLSTGYYFVRSLLLVGAIAGGLVALYRNDVFRELARRAGQEPRYLAAESFLVGTPGWGTPRSMEPVLAETSGPLTPAAPTVTPPVAEPATVAEMPAAVAPVPEQTAAAPTAAPTPPPAAPEPVAAAVVARQEPPAPPPAAAPAPAPAPPPKPIDPLAPVSLDSLPVLTKSGTLSQPVAFNEPPSRAAAPPAPVTRAAAPAPAARPAPAPVDRSRTKAIRVSLDEGSSPGAGRSATRAAAPPPEAAPAPVARKPDPPKAKATAVHKNDNPLMAAVRSAVRARPAKESVPAAD